VPLGARPEGIVADARTRLLAVVVNKPPELLLLDVGTGEERERISLPAPARHLQLAGAGGPVLVPSEGADALLTVELPTGRISDRIPTGDFPHDATTANGAVFVANEFAGTIGVIRDGRMTRTLAGHTQPGGIAAAAGAVGVVDVRRNDLTVYDARSLDRIGRAPAGSGPTHVVADRRGRMLVTDTRGNTLRIFDVRPQPRETAAIALPGGPYGIAYDKRRDRVWVTLTGRNEVVGVDLSSTPPSVTERVPTVRQPNTVAVDPATGRVFVAGKAGSELQIVDP
ncbi:MAG: YncE family protein, partial [Thermocrispum sp.]